MSIQEIQARTAEISARLQALAGGTPLAGGVVGAVPTDASATFASTLSDVQSSAALPAATPTALGTSAVALAEQQIGTPYVWGGSKPGGFDCSGLVQWTYGQLGVTLPRLAEQQGKAGTPVSPADAQAGDLVYFNHPGSVDHIGIYIGNGKWVVAPHTGAQVRIEDVDLSKATSIRRVTGTPSAAPGTWAAALPAAGQQYAAQLQQAADKAGVDPRLLSAVAWTESGFNAGATSGAGAQGLMQLMPQTAAGLGVNALDPAQALDGGARYLKQQLTAFGGRADLALAAYNAGPTAVRKAGGVPPYAETQAYVARVLDRYRQLGGTA
ncbi:MAG: Membrane-bound lytic murein transglycosylase precursor [Frankiales bacterium]|nr:Membrane-bound lytic murein transglycosylase precursor [Frankiales bacterium]